MEIYPFLPSHGNKYEWDPKDPSVYIKGRKKMCIVRVNKNKLFSKKKIDQKSGFT